MKSNLTRRSLLSSTLAAAALAPLRIARAQPIEIADACILMPEQALGPYYLADELIRSDIREGKPGVPLALRLLVLDARNQRDYPLIEGITVVLGLAVMLINLIVDCSYVLIDPRVRKE